MHPTICHLGPVALHSYGLMLAIAVIVSSVLFSRSVKKIGVGPDSAQDLVFWVVICGILGARFFFVLLNWQYYMAAPVEIFKIWEGGLAWQGSLLAGVLTTVIYTKRKHLPLWKLLDVAAPYIALGHAIGRIGCFLNGCCYGKAASWGLYFPVWDARLHPTQLYMVAGQLIIFLVLRKAQFRAVYAGQVFVWYLMLSAVERFLVEFARADHELYGPLSIFQYICLAIFIAAIVMNIFFVKIVRKA